MCHALLGVESTCLGRMLCPESNAPGLMSGDHLGANSLPCAVAVCCLAIIFKLEGMVSHPTIILELFRSPAGLLGRPLLLGFHRVP
jgi:hypothetical protein